MTRHDSVLNMSTGTLRTSIDANSGMLDEVKLIAKIGGGNFGEVYKGMWQVSVFFFICQLSMSRDLLACRDMSFRVQHQLQ